MLQFLKDIGISDITILKMINNNSEDILYDLECDQVNCLEVIKYLQELNIQVIDDLLINEIGMFFKTKEYLANKFSKFNISEIVDDINDDYIAIESVLYD